MNKIKELFTLLPKSKVLISGFHTDNYSEIDFMVNALEELQIPKSQVITHYANDTFDTMRQLKKIHTNKPESQIILVSQKFHLERANIIANLLAIPVENIETSSNNLPNKNQLIFREYFARIKVYLDYLKFFTRLS